LVDGKIERFVAVIRGETREIAFRDGRETPPSDAAPTVLAVEGGVLVLHGGRQTHVAPAHALDGAEFDAAESDGALKAPMHGRLIALSVADGDAVEAGQRLAVVEAMKMEHPLTAPVAGRAKLAGPKVGDTVEQGTLILSVET
jgi:3-methylcrotonyl-CoA carboxylase alpha subunit